MLNHFKLLVAIVMFYINTTTAYPANINYYPQVLLEELQENRTQVDVVYPDIRNTSSLQLSPKPVPDRRARQVSGCLLSTRAEPCGSVMVVTVKCRKQSITCSGPRLVPDCVIKRTYFKECDKVFDTDCSCKY